nr:integrase, catalytic region, zinc finger, CCHC-type, peptidase aspartic, catalytic [Tanacetum cinerariifolium]
MDLPGTVCFGNDHIAAILGYGDLKWGNITITRVYFVEGLGHNLFSVGQFFDADLEVAFRRNTCFIRDLDGVDFSKVIVLQISTPSISMTWPQLLPYVSWPVQLLISRGYGINDYPTSTLTPSTTLTKMISSLVYQSLKVIKNFLKKIYVRLQAPVIIVRTDNGTEFKNHVLKEYCDSVGITHETQQNGVVERRNCTLVEAARTMLISLMLRIHMG